MTCDKELLVKAVIKDFLKPETILRKPIRLKLAASKDVVSMMLMPVLISAHSFK